MSFTQIVGKLDESRNLNSSPWTVSGLRGDKFDYPFMIFNESSNAAASDLLIRPNGDSGLNCEYAQMWAANTQKGGANDTTQDGFRVADFVRGVSNRNSLSIGLITGDSSQDRICKFLMSHGDPSLSQFHCKWNNNVDELTSLEFYGTGNASYKWHIVVFEVPKIGNDDQWELINTLSWSASSIEQSFTDLEGDTDKQYLITTSDAEEAFLPEFNNDDGANYNRERIQNTGSAFQADSYTGGTDIWIQPNSQVVVNAESGVDRTVFEFNGYEVYLTSPHSIQAYWWKNTADEITSIDITPAAAITATAKLFRRKNPKVPADIFRLPFEFVQKIDVDSADFTAGDSFTGLESDKVLMYRLEFTGVQTNIINLLSNGDTGASDYAYQYLRGIGTAEAAGIDTAHNVVQLCDDSNGDSCNAVMYIYPRSGEYRPMVGYAMNDEDEILLRAAWRLDSATEITSLKVLTSATGQITGTFTLSAIYL